jgi:hypothetical protein
MLNACHYYEKPILVINLILTMISPVPFALLKHSGRLSPGGYSVRV